MRDCRVLYGLGRIPSSIRSDDPALPSVCLSPAPLRLNTEPLPNFISRPSESAARRSILADWLITQCGNYSVRLHRFIREYLNFVGSAVIQNKDVLADKIAPFDGLYSVDDWFWSAPRPLPRAWIREGEVWTSAAMVFWDGSALITLTESELNPAQLQALLPDPLRWWRDEILPSSPFRRPWNHTVISST